MKAITTIFLFLSFHLFVVGQMPDGMSFQAVVYDEDSKQVTNQTIGMRFTFLKDNTTLYSETQTATTNNAGLVSLIIGQGTPIEGTYSDIPWYAGNIRLKREYDLTGGANYTVTGEEFLYPVPYAKYAANSGPSYLMDAHGQFIPTIQVGNLEWMAANLSVTAYNDGSPIDASDVFVYGDDDANLSIYGRLYSWEAVDQGNLCPIGWRVPTKTEWEQLIAYFSDGKVLKAVTTNWTGFANNHSGFSAQPGGSADGLGNYSGLGALGFYWTSTPQGSAAAWNVGFFPGTNDPILEDIYSTSYGMSVRCVK